MKKNLGTCPTCGHNRRLTRHHIVPRAFIKNHYPSMAKQNRFYFNLCRECHDELHHFIWLSNPSKPSHFFKLLWRFCERSEECVNFFLTSDS